MDGYLTQIANRGDASVATNGITPAPKHYFVAETPLADPFEQTIKEQSSNVAAPQSSVEQKIVNPFKMPVSDSTTTQTILQESIKETNYLTRHVIRLKEEEQKIITSKRLISTDDHPSPVINQQKIEHANITDDADRHFFKEEGLADGDEKRTGTPVNIKLLNPQDQKTMQAEPKQSIQGHETLSVQPSHFSPVMPIAQERKQMIFKEKRETIPQLVIGRITVQVLPPEKPQVIHKIEKRTIIESKPASSQVHSKFIFGLGQL